MSEVYYEVRMTRVLHTARISNVDSAVFVSRIREMLSFELGKERERCFSSCHERGTNKNSESPCMQDACHMKCIITYRLAYSIYKSIACANTQASKTQSQGFNASTNYGRQVSEIRGQIATTILSV